MKSCIKYDAEKWNDGAGAQIQRIAAVYSISIEFGLKYIQQDVIHIESNPGDGFKTTESKDNFICKLNEYFRITEVNCSSPHTTVTLRYHKIMKFRLGARLYFLSAGILSFFSRKHLMYVCDNPYPILENYPNIYRHFTNRFGKKIRSDEEGIQIQLHIRGSKNGNQLMSSRQVELSWYIAILRFIDVILKRLELNYRVIIHTDAPSEEIKWKPLDISEATKRFWKSASVMNQHGEITLSPIDFKREFDFVKNLEVIRNIDPIQAWEMMSFADVLVLGRSSFSIIAGLINDHSLIISPKYRHKFPQKWLIKEDNVQFSALEVNRIEKYFTSLANGFRN